MKQHLRIMSLLFICSTFLLSGYSASSSSVLIFDEERIKEEVQVLNTQHMVLRVEGETHAYDTELLDSYAEWYLKRDEGKVYSNPIEGVGESVQIGAFGYWYTAVEVEQTGEKGLAQMDKRLDELFRFYAMVNVRDTTPRTYRKGDPGFSKLTKVYSKLADVPRKEIAKISIDEGEEEEGGTRLTITGPKKHKDEGHKLVTWEDKVEFQFNYDSKEFNEVYNSAVSYVTDPTFPKPGKYRY